MVKVRLSGLSNDIAKITEQLKKHFKILLESDIYKNKNSEYTRKYFEIDVIDNEKEK